MRNRRTAILTFAGIGFFHLVAGSVVMLLLSAGPSGAGRDVPQRPALGMDSSAAATVPPYEGAASPKPAHAVLETQWTAYHKDAASPWTVDTQGRINWR